ncbi:unnamed protein product [Alopecurus aequalis]
MLEEGCKRESSLVVTYLHFSFYSFVIVFRCSLVPTMKLIAAYLLAHLAGKSSPSAADIKNILESVGAEADEEKLEHLLAELKGKDITEVIASGREKFASVPSGGGAIAGGAPAAAAGGGGGAPAAEAKKEEKVEEKEESDDDMGFSLFD